MNHRPETRVDSSTDRWSAELCRAVRAVRPEYFTWSADEQLRYRVKVPTDDNNAIVDALLGDDCLRQEASMAGRARRNRLPLEVQHRINEQMQPLRGIGEDAFVLNEYFAEDESILDFETLIDYDRADHAFQQDANRQERKDHRPESYTGALRGTWARILVDGQLYYLTLTMASWHLCGIAEDAASAEIEARIAHRYVRGPEHGARDESGSFLSDMRVDANGQEALLEALQNRALEEQFRRRSELSEMFFAQRQAVCFLDDDPWEGAPPRERNLHVVFSDPEALAAVRFTSFLRDCRRIERPLIELRALEVREAKRMRAFVAANHEDLLKNFEPGTVPQRKKLRILFHPEALRDMEDDGSS